MLLPVCDCVRIREKWTRTTATARVMDTSCQDKDHLSQGSQVAIDVDLLKIKHIELNI